MTKRSESTQERGEALLREWGVGEDAQSARAVWGRDSAADTAIIARLEKDGAADALVSLEGVTTDKTVRKEIRRALFRLEQRGLEVPKREAAPVVASLGAAEIEGYLSASDGNGDQLLWLVKPRRGELLQLFAVVNDPDGMREAEMHPVTRKVLRAAREDLMSRHAIRIVDADWRYCDQRMHQAYRWTVERGGAVAGDYLGLRNQLLSEAPAEVAHPIFTVLDAETLRSDEGLLAASAALCEEDELRTWFFPAEKLKVYLDEVEQAQNSPLLLNPHQQNERLGQIIERAVDEIFGAARDSYRRRLLDLAWVLYASKRLAPAKQAAAVALALETRRGGAGIPFCETLVRSSFAAHMRVAAERQQERAKESLIVTPQEVARAAQRRRPR